MNSLSKKIVKLGTYPFKTWYLFFELCQAYFCHQQPMKILFSKKDDWEPSIRRLCQFLPHSLSFTNITPETIVEHDLVIPLNIEDVLYLSQHPELLNNNLIPIPNFDCVTLCDDKYLFAQKLIANNFSSYIPQINGNLAYPFFLKKKIDVGGLNCHLIENDEQANVFANEIKSDNYFCQQAVFGKREYAVHIFFKNNQAIRVITMEYIFEKDSPIKNKDKELGVKIIKNNPEHIKLLTEILTCINYQGICCFNYKLINNKPLIFEINPRVGGSLALYLFSFLRNIE